MEESRKRAKHQNRGGAIMEKDISSQLVDFALETKYKGIPKEVMDFTKHLTLKTVAGMIAGSTKSSGRKMAEVIKGQRLPEAVSVMGSGFKTALWEAVLINAYYAHASELEDDRISLIKNGGTTWDITVIPLLFSLAENLSLPGKPLLESLALGLEIGVRAGLWGGKHLGLGQICGAIGATAAASRALGLGVRETKGALGLAISSVPLAVVSYGTDGHYFESAMVPLQAMIATQMAKVGLMGNPDMATFLTKFLGKDVVTQPEKIVEGLGEKWMLCEIWIKKYPCCTWQHRQIDLLLEMKKKHNLSIEGIESIEVHASATEKICDRPVPKNEAELQFSFQHVLSAAMLDGDVHLKNVSLEVLDDPRMREARKKVHFILHPEWPLSAMTDKVPARLVVKMTDGRTFEGERAYPIGSPQEPLTTEQCRKLYEKFTKGILSDKDISMTADMILNLEELSCVKSLTDITRNG
jgi:2-methylcitrate dehydratase PrpD